MTIGAKIFRKGQATSALAMVFSNLAVAVPMVIVPTAAQAQQAARNFSIPPQPLASALTAFGDQADLQVTVDTALITGLSTSGVTGSLAPLEALSRILTGTGLTWRMVNNRTVRLERAPQGADNGVHLGPVRVEGTGGGGAMAGLRDPGTTEGTLSYTTSVITVGKTAASLRETPQSVSVVTRQRIEDQNFTDISEALKFSTGVITQSQGGIYTDHSAFARGASADFQLDGVNQTVDSRSAQFDLAIYDRVEVLRGPAGLFRGAGSAGATINLVRKRAQAEFAVAGAVSGGSWTSFRAEGDVTGALNQSGSIRGRFVAAGEDRGSFLDGINNSKYVAFGTIELDLSEATVLSVGGTAQNARMKYFFGLPAYASGQHPDVRRGKSYTAPWSNGDLNNYEAFGELEHRFDAGGSIKAVVRHSESTRASQTLFSGSGLSPSGIQSLGANRERVENATTAGDIFFDTPVEIGGQTHNFLIGGDFQDYSQTTLRRGGGTLPVVDFFAFDPRSIPEPDFANIPLAANAKAKTKSYGIYSQVRIKPVDWMTLVGGGRFSWRDVRNFDRLTNRETTGPDVKGKFTPFGAVIFDVTSDLSLYGSYAEVFQPQGATTIAGDLLPPIIGRQVEAGIKGEFLDGLLNASMALYRTTRSNEALADPVNPGFSIAGGKRRAQGFEAEVTGEILTGWNITAGYAYNETKILVAAMSQIGQAYAPSTPKHNLTLWSNYRFPTSGALGGLEVGGGLRSHSLFYNQVGTVRFESDGYTVASLMLGYQINENLRASVNVENLFDRTYFTKVGNATANNYYGAPRNFMATIRARY